MCIRDSPGVLQLEMGNTPSNLASLGIISFGSQDKIGARIDGRADQDWNINSAHGTHIRFLTTANGSASNPTERLRINSDGDMGLGTDAPSVRCDISDSDSTAWSTSNLSTALRVVNSSGTNGVAAGIQLRTINNNGAAGIQYIHCVNSSSNYSSDLVFSRRLHPSGTYAESCRITNAGNLKFPNGKGIDFSATEGSGHTGDSVFDDYEVGDWTPAVTGLTGIQDAVGRYIKIGDQVTCAWYFNIGTKTYASGYSSTQAFYITGLPYGCEHGNGGPWYGASIGNFQYCDNLGGGNNQLMLNIGDGYSYLFGRRGRFGNYGFSNMQLGDFYNNFAMHGSITYRTA